LDKLLVLGFFSIFLLLVPIPNSFAFPGDFLEFFVGDSQLQIPRGLVFGPDDNLYVSSGGNDRILRYNQNSGNFKGIFAIGGGLDGPYGLVFGPDGNLYVSSVSSHEVKRYDGTTGTFIDTFVGCCELSVPTGLVFGPDGNLYVSSDGNNQVLRFDGNNGTPLPAPGESGAVFASGGGLDGPFGLVFGPDDNLYVSSLDTDQVLRYDGNTGMFIGVFASGGGLGTPDGLDFGPDGNLYVISSLSSQVLRYDGNNGTPLPAPGESGAVFAGGGGLSFPSGIDFGPDDNLYVVGVGSDEVFLFNGITGDFIVKFVSDFPRMDPDNPVHLVFGPDSNLYVSTLDTDQVLRYNGNTGMFIDVFASGGGLNDPHGLIFSPDGNLFVSGRSPDQVLRYDGNSGTPLPAPGESGAVFASGGGLSFPSGIDFGPDGNLYVSNVGSDQVLRFDGNNGTPLPAPGESGAVFASGGGLGNPLGLEFGPDGNLYVSSTSTDQVLRYNGNTGAFIDVFASGGGLNSPNGLVFGPDGNLYVSATRSFLGSPDQVLRYDGNSGTFMNVFAGGAELNSPRDLIFGPDGNLYVSDGFANRIILYEGLGNLFGFNMKFNCDPSVEEFEFNFPFFTRDHVRLIPVFPGGLICPPDFEDDVFMLLVPNGFESVIFLTVGGQQFAGVCDLSNLPEPPNFEISFDIVNDEVVCTPGSSTLVVLSLVPEGFNPPPPDNGPVGGKIIQIDTTSLILAGAQTFSWMIPVLASIVGIGLFFLRRK